MESLTLSSAPNLTHTRLVEILSRGGMERLSELAIMEAPQLGQQSVRLLITHLPSLTLLGRLDGWRVRPEQLEDLRKWVANENYNIMLWYNLPVDEQHEDVDFDHDFDED